MKTNKRQQILEAKQKAMKLRVLSGRPVVAGRRRSISRMPGSVLEPGGQSFIALMQEFCRITDPGLMSMFLARTAVVNEMGGLKDEKAWTDLVEALRAIRSKNEVEASIDDHYAAMKGARLNLEFHQHLALKLWKIFAAQIDAISFLRKHVQEPTCCDKVSK